MNRNLSLAVKLLVSVIIIYFIVQYIGWQNIFESLKTFNLWYLIPAGVFLFLNYIFNALNLYTLLNMDQQCVGFLHVLRVYAITIGISLFLPGVIGQASMILLFKRNTKSFGKGTGVFILDRIWVLLVVLVGASLSAFIFIPQEALYFIIVCAFLIVLFVLFFATSFGNKILFRLITFLCPKKLYLKLGNVFGVLQNYPTNKLVILKNVLFSIARWACRVLWVFFIIMGFGVYLSPFMIYSVCAWEALLSMIPITFSGLGIKEGVGLFLYEKLGVSVSVIGGVYFIINLFVYVVGAAVLVLLKKEDVSWHALFAKEKIQKI